MPLAEIKNHLSEVVDEVVTTQARVTITRHGRPAAVLISIDELSAIEETLEVLSDPETVAALRESRRQKAVRMTKSELLKELGISE
jgi:prevent-host-death family protein